MGQPRGVDTRPGLEAVAVVPGYAALVRGAVAVRAHAEDGDVPGVGLREVLHHPLGELGLLGRAVLLTGGGTGGGAKLRQLGIDLCIGVQLRPNPQLSDLLESGDLEDSPGKPRAILHLHQQVPHSLQVLGPLLHGSALLLSLLCCGGQLGQRALQILQVGLLVRQLLLCLSDRLNPCAALLVEQRHLRSALLLHGLLARVVITRLPRLLHQVLDDQEALAPRFLELLPLRFALLSRKCDCVCKLPIRFLGPGHVMRFDRGRWSGRLLGLLQLQRRDLVLPGSRHTSLQIARSGNQLPGCHRGSHRRPRLHAQQLELLRPTLSAGLFQKALKQGNRSFWAGSELLKLFQFCAVHLELSACFFFLHFAIVQSLLIFGMLFVDSVLQILDDSLLCTDLLHQCGLTTVCHVQLKMQHIHRVLKPVQLRVAGVPGGLLLSDHLRNFRVHVVLLGPHML
mmetsp:Transcript_7602/g.18810  ORF Transcript_7602/g.18810 Transcript_7602/m.18810 type:complete len:454 (-) Transcript_7602:275-1636(-)